MYSNEEYDDGQETQGNGSFLKNFYYNNKVLIWIFIGVIVFILLMSLLTKGGSNNNTPTNYNVTIDYPGDKIEISIGSSTRVNAKVENQPNATIIWSSDNENVATVDNGNITAVNYGKTTIRAVYLDANNKQSAPATKEVIVSDGNPNLALTDVSFQNGDLLLPLNSSYQISLSLTPSNGYVTNKVFSSTNENVVTVDNTGLVKSVGEGEATINVNINNGLFNRNLKVFVNSDYTKSEIIVTPETIKFDGELRVMKVGMSEKLNFTVFPVDTDRSKLIWTSNDPTVATVDENGIVKALREGNTTITIKSITGVSNTIDIEVESDIVEVTDINLSLNDLYLTVGQNQLITPIVIPDNASNKSLSFIAGDASIISVAANETGTAASVIGLRSGTTTLMIISNNNVSKIINVTVADNSSSESGNSGGNSGSGSTSSQGFTISSSDANGGKFVNASYNGTKPANNGATGPVTVTITKTDSSIAKLRVVTCKYPASNCDPSVKTVNLETIDSGSFTMSSAGEWVIRVGKFDSNNNLIGYVDKYIWIKDSASTLCCITRGDGTKYESTISEECKRAGQNGATVTYGNCPSAQCTNITGKAACESMLGCQWNSSTNKCTDNSNGGSLKDPGVKINNSTSSIISLSDTTVGSTVTFQEQAAVEGTFTNTINSTSCLEWADGQNYTTERIVSGTAKKPYANLGIPLKAKNCSTPQASVTVKFVPKNSEYKTVTKTVKVTIVSAPSVVKTKCGNPRYSTVCSYVTYSSKTEIENKGITSGCVKANTSYCGALATSCYAIYNCSKS